ncbi:hypothetical protein B0H11DRAFT_2230743 [Mycena galericulata]|nr:hypothetical protein B0H11DRAFT_2230743 [Mycena galericulata]
MYHLPTLPYLVRLARARQRPPLGARFGHGMRMLELPPSPSTLLLLASSPALGLTTPAPRRITTARAFGARPLLAAYLGCALIPGLLSFPAPVPLGPPPSPAPAPGTPHPSHCSPTPSPTRRPLHARLPHRLAYRLASPPYRLARHHPRACTRLPAIPLSPPPVPAPATDTALFAPAFPHTLRWNEHTPFTPSRCTAWPASTPAPAPGVARPSHCSPPPSPTPRAWSEHTTPTRHTARSAPASRALCGYTRHTARLALPTHAFPHTPSSTARLPHPVARLLPRRVKGRAKLRMDATVG